MTDDAFLEGVIAVVTGASSGIGRATAVALAAAGARVALASRRTEALLALAAEINRGTGPGRAVAVPTDVGREDEVARLAEAVRRELGPARVLVNSAGQGYASSVVGLDTDRLDEVMRVNFRGAVLCTKYLLPDMLEQRAGAIVNVGSISSRAGWANGTPYVASKFALRGFALCLWKEVHTQGIRVVNVYPGAVASGLYEASGMPFPDIERAIPPADIAAIIVSTLRLPQNTDVVELDVWPTNLHG